MMDPRYRDVKRSEIPEVSIEAGRSEDRLRSGKRRAGPGPGHRHRAEYLDVSVPKGGRFTHPVKRGHTVFAYVVEGSACFDTERERPCGPERPRPIRRRRRVSITAEGTPVRFLLVSGKPIGEPVAWYGPIVMNTSEEIRIAFEEYRNGTFIKHR